MTKTQDIVTKKHKIRNILCFLSVVAISYNKDGFVVRNSCTTNYIIQLIELRLFQNNVIAFANKVFDYDAKLVAMR